MESLLQNKSLLYSLLSSAAVILGLCGFLPDLAAQFEIVEFPSDVSKWMYNIKLVYTIYIRLCKLY